MPRVRRTRQARQDVAQLWRYIAERNFDAAERWLSAVDDAVQLLGRFPGIGQRRPELGTGLQSYPVGNYLIFFRQGKDAIEILRVLHGARDLRQFFEGER